MLIILTVMLTGILIGRLTRSVPGMPLKQLTLFLVWCLLLILGYEAGANDDVMTSIGTLGLKAFILSVAGLAGSILLSSMLWHSIKHKEEHR
ncbi:MAG: LysO family transporter [Prevotella sp.]